MLLVQLLLYEAEKDALCDLLRVLSAPFAKILTNSFCLVIVGCSGTGEGRCAIKADERALASPAAGEMP